MPPSVAELINSYKEPYEPEEQWKLRKAFLERNWEAFPKERRNRLLALAKCFQNIRFLGCSYAAPVMDEVARLSVGLVDDQPRPKPKRLAFSKIVFVKAAAPDAISALDAEEDDESEEDEVDACTTSAGDEVDGAPLKSPQKTKQVLATVSPAVGEEVADEDLEEEPMDMGRTGLGFGGKQDGVSAKVRKKKKDVPQDGAASATSQFVFGKADYAKRMGFVKSAAQEPAGNEFKFGVPFTEGLDKVKPSGQFQFGGVLPPTVQGDAPKETLGNSFKFGAGGDYAAKMGFVKSAGRSAERRKSSEDLSHHLQSTSLCEGPIRKSPKLDSSSFDAVLASLNELRSQLRKIRPPLQKARIEYAMLQVAMAVTAAGAKVEWDRGQSQTMRVFGVQLAKGADEQATYRDFISKVFDSQAWKIALSPAGPMLELGTQPPTGQPVTPRTPVPTEQPAEASISSRAAPPVEQNRMVNGQIIRNLIEIRNTIWTPNFKSKVAMFGGPESDIQSTLNMAFQLAKLKPVRDAPVPGTFLRPEFSTKNRQTACRLVFHGVVLIEACGASKPEAKATAAKKLYKILESQAKFEISDNNGRLWLQMSGSRKQDRRAQMVSEPQPQTRPAVSASPQYRDLFVIRPARGVNLQGLISMFASANGLALTFETDTTLQEGATVQVCRVHLSTEPPLTFEGFGETKQLARGACIREALNNLIQNCSTIHIKQTIVDGAQEFSKEGMPLGLESQAVQEGLGRQLDEDNAGYRLLQNMGWRGGALGQGSGLVEPIMLKDNTGNRGLGYEGSGAVSKRFKGHVASTLRVFLRETDVFDELKFSPSFSNVERKEIHQIARRLGLKSKSQNRPEGRVLCISHNIDWRMILNRLKQSGSSGKYELLPPNSWTPPES